MYSIPETDIRYLVCTDPYHQDEWYIWDKQVRREVAWGSKLDMEHARIQLNVNSQVGQ